jgi:hypothetical protein
MMTAPVSLNGIVKSHIRGKQRVQVAERATRQLHLGKGRLIDAGTSVAA